MAKKVIICSDLTKVIMLKTSTSDTKLVFMFVSFTCQIRFRYLYSLHYVIQLITAFSAFNPINYRKIRLQLAATKNQSKYYFSPLHNADV